MAGPSTSPVGPARRVLIAPKALETKSFIVLMAPGWSSDDAMPWTTSTMNERSPVRILVMLSMIGLSSVATPVSAPPAAPVSPPTASPRGPPP